MRDVKRGETREETREEMREEMKGETIGEMIEERIGEMIDGIMIGDMKMTIETGGIEVNISCHNFEHRVFSSFYANLAVNLVLMMINIHVLDKETECNDLVDHESRRDDRSRVDEDNARRSRAEEESSRSKYDYNKSFSNQRKDSESYRHRREDETRLTAVITLNNSTNQLSQLTYTFAFNYVVQLCSIPQHIILETEICTCIIFLSSSLLLFTEEKQEMSKRGCLENDLPPWILTRGKAE